MVGGGGARLAGVADEELRFDCPRCRQAVSEGFYGPCAECRQELRATYGGEGHDVAAGRYEPEMNVVPNQVATKD